jgi:hypothetical protein
MFFLLEFSILTQTLAEDEMRRRDLVLGVAATLFAAAGQAFSQQTPKNWDIERVGKQLQLFREHDPKLDSVGILAATRATDGGYGETFVEGLQPAATRAGLRLVPVLVDGPNEFKRAFETMSKAGAQVVIIEKFFAPQRMMLHDIATKHHFAGVLFLLPRTD